MLARQSAEVFRIALGIAQLSPPEHAGHLAQRGQLALRFGQFGVDLLALLARRELGFHGRQARLGLLELGSAGIGLGLHGRHPRVPV